MQYLSLFNFVGNSFINYLFNILVLKTALLRCNKGNFETRLLNNFVTHYECKQVFIFIACVLCIRCTAVLRFRRYRVATAAKTIQDDSATMDHG